MQKKGLAALYFYLILLITAGCTSDKTTAPTNDRRLSTAVEDYLKTNFAQPGATTSWHPMILLTRISHQPKGNIIEVVTMLDKTDKQTASNICGAVSGYWQNHQSQINGLRIIGTGQKIISYRYSLGGGCS